MATGKSIQLNKQIGEYLVASELARRGFLVATFSGNVPDFDIIASDGKGNTLPIQVKTIRGGDWQFSVDKFIEVKFEGKKQILGKPVAPRIPHLIHVFVLAKDYGRDRFFILEWEQLQEMIIKDYSAWLDSKGGIRPKNHESMHCHATVKSLEEFEDRWEMITERFK